MSLHELKRLYAEGRLVLFVGAGVSRSVEWTVDGEPLRGPSWRELVEEAARQLGFEDPGLLRVRGSDLQILEYYRLRFGSYQQLTNWLLKNMSPPDSALTESPVHKAIADLKAVTSVYTTNYDDFLERALRSHGRSVRRVATELHLTEPRASCDVVKFHGDWDNQAEMVLTESDYEARLRLEGLMDRKLQSDLLGSAVLFLGYSFRDPNVAYLFRLLNERFAGLPGSKHGTRGYIAVGDPSEFEVALFQARNIEVLPLDTRDLTGDLVGLLAGLTG